MKRQFTFIPRVTIYLSVGVGLALALPAGAQMDEHSNADNPHLRITPTPTPKEGQAAGAKLSQKDSQFISKIAAGGVQEVADAQVAMKQGNETTKKIASQIASERGSSNKELLALAKKKGLGLGTDKIKPRSMGKTNYDKQYVYTTSHDYQEDIALFQKAAQSADDKDIKAWAAKTLPMLKQHQSMLKSAGK